MQLKTIALLSAMLMTSTGAAFAGEAWRIVDTAGTVRAGGAGFMPVALTRNQTLPADAWIETAATGRVILARGSETIVVQPNSRVQLPDGEVNGNTQVLQTLGSALYKIGKQQKPHFQVDTPYLAAVVKGTEFTVAVDGSEASVTVTEGLVEVATPDRSDVEFVKPGFTATVTAGQHGDVVVDQTPGDEHAKTDAEHGNGGSKDDDKDNNGKNDKAANAGHGPVVIPVAIGDVMIDVKEVSGGLAFGEFKTAEVDNGKDETANDGDSKGKDKNDTSVVDLETDAIDAAGPKLNPGKDIVSAAPDLGSDVGVAPDLGGGKTNNGNGGVNVGNGNAAPDLGSVVPNLGGGNGNTGGGNGNGGGGNGNTGGGNGNSGGNGNGAKGGKSS